MQHNCKQTSDAEQGFAQLRFYSFVGFLYVQQVVFGRVVLGMKVVRRIEVKIIIFSS